MALLTLQSALRRTAETDTTTDAHWASVPRGLKLSDAPENATRLHVLTVAPALARPARPERSSPGLDTESSEYVLRDSRMLFFHADDQRSIFMSVYWGMS